MPAPPTTDDTAERVAWARHLEQTRLRPRVRGEESLLMELVMRRIVVFGIVVGAPVAVLLVDRLASRGSVFAFCVGVGTVLAVVVVATWCAAPTIAARWYRGQRTWWLLDGRIVAGRRRARALQLLMVAGVLTWSLAALLGALVAAVPSDEPAASVCPIQVPRTITGSSEPVFLVPDLDRQEEPLLPAWGETVVTEAALVLITGAVAGIGHASRYR